MNSIHPYDSHSKLHNIFFHPLHQKAKKRIVSVITHIFMTIFSCGLWQIPFWIVNKLDHKKLKNWNTVPLDKKDIGKKTGSSFWTQRKVLISHTKKEGWKLKKLNKFQLFARKYLGLYKSTHLNHLNKIIRKNKPPEGDLKDYHDKIHSQWIKKNIAAVGNSNFSDSKVFCFAEKHGDKAFRSFIASVINNHYEDGDIVLVEGVESSKQVSARDLPQTKKLNSNCIIYGWEPENFREIIDPVFKGFFDKNNEVNKIIESFKYLENKEEFTLDELNDLKKNLDDLSSKIEELNTYFRSKSKIIKNAKANLDEFFEKLKNREFPGTVMLYAISKIMSELEKEYENSMYKNMSKEGGKAALASAGPRNESLIRAIAKYRQEGRKVFVIAGASHFLNFPPPWISSDNVREALRSDPFVILAKKSDFKKVAKLNQELEPVELA